MNEVRNQLEALLIEANWFPTAPFRWIGLMFRYGLKTEDAPHFETIDKTDGELAIAIEIDTKILLDLNNSKVGLARFITRVALDCLISVGTKYQLPTERLAMEKSKLNAT